MTENVKVFKIKVREGILRNEARVKWAVSVVIPAHFSVEVTDITDKVEAMEKELQEWKDLHSQPWLFKEQDDVV